MALGVTDNFDYMSDKPNFKRDQFDTLEEMKAYTVCDDGHISYCKYDGKRYEYKSSNSDDATTGKWREYKTGSDAPIKKGYGYNSVVMNEEENVAYTSYIRVKSGIAKIVVQNSEMEIPVDKDPDRTKPQVGNVVNGCLITEVNMSSSSSNWSIKVMLIDSSMYRAEFEADEIYDVYTKNVALGWATAEGQGTSATGFYSHAEGYNTTASGDQSHAEGLGTKATGEGAHAEGVGGSTASGDGAHAEGMGNTASGKCAHAEGSGGTTASGEGSHAEGTGSTASGRCAHAEGSGGVNASGEGAHAEGGGTSASGYTSHAEGSGTTANNQCAHAEGGGSKAYGMYSHAEGSGCEAGENGKNNTGIGAHAEGSGSKALGSGSHSEGSATAHGQNSHAEGSGSNAYGTASHSEGSGTAGSSTDSNVGFAHAEGMGSTASGEASHAEGGGTTASDAQAHAEGSGTTASGQASHSEGSGTIASGVGSHAEGGGTTASGVCSHAEGSSNYATATSSHAEGSGNTASGDYSHAEGYGTTASKVCSHTEGEGTKVTNNGEHAEGIYNDSHTDGYDNGKSTIHSVGIGESNNARINAHEIMRNGDHYFGTGKLYKGKFGTDSKREIDKYYRKIMLPVKYWAKVEGDSYSIMKDSSSLTEDYNIPVGGYVYPTTNPTLILGDSSMQIYSFETMQGSTVVGLHKVNKTVIEDSSWKTTGIKSELLILGTDDEYPYIFVNDDTTINEAMCVVDSKSLHSYNTQEELAEFQLSSVSTTYDIYVDSNSGNCMYDFRCLAGTNLLSINLYLDESNPNETTLYIPSGAILKSYKIGVIEMNEEPTKDVNRIISIQSNIIIYGSYETTTDETDTTSLDEEES